MTDLVALLSSGKGTWGHVGRLIADGEWDNIFLVTNDFGRENFTAEKESTFMVVEQRQPIVDMANAMHEALKDKVKGEIALNIVSGTGKEHMALLSALKKCDVTFKLMCLTKEGIQEL